MSPGEGLQRVPSQSCIIDGELVAADAGGFWTIAGAAGENGPGVCVVSFDLLPLDGHDLRGLLLIERKDRLQGLLAKFQVPSLVYSDHFPDGSSLLKAAERLRLEGVVSKRRDAPYRSGCCSSWVKTKCETWLAANRDRWQAFARR